jgi:hypothetical protein
MPDKAGLEVLESSDIRMVFDKGGLHPCAEYSRIIETVNGQIQPTPEISYDRFLATVKASPSEKLVAKSMAAHVRAADFPEMTSRWHSVGHQAGFSREKRSSRRSQLWSQWHWRSLGY